MLILVRGESGICTVCSRHVVTTITPPSQAHLDILHVLVEQDLTVDLTALDQRPHKVFFGKGKADLRKKEAAAGGGAQQKGGRLVSLRQQKEHSSATPRTRTWQKKRATEASDSSKPERYVDETLRQAARNTDIDAEDTCVCGCVGGGVSDRWQKKKSRPHTGRRPFQQIKLVHSEQDQNTKVLRFASPTCVPLSPTRRCTIMSTFLIYPIRCFDVI